MTFLRSLGYLAVTVVWFVIFLITVAIAFCFWVVPPGQISTQQGILEKLQEPADWVSGLVLVYLMFPFVWGFVFLLVLMSLGPLMLAALAFWRSLQPRFAGGKLTGNVLRGDAVGISPGGVAVSLLPRRHSAYSRWATRLNVRAWLIDGSWYLGLSWLGFVQFLLLAWFRWPIHNIVLVVLTILLSIGFLVLSVRSLRTGWRRLEITAVDGELPVAVKST